MSTASTSSTQRRSSSSTPPGRAELADSEPARVSGRRRAVSRGLTPSEQRLPELADSGLPEEVAARLFVNLYTLEALFEAHLFSNRVGRRRPRRDDARRLALRPGHRSRFDRDQANALFHEEGHTK